MSKASQDSLKKKGGFTKTHALLIVAVIVIAALVFVIYTLLKPKPEPPLGNLVVDDSNLGTIGDEMANKIAKGTFETYMNTTWRFADGKSPSSNAVVGNAAVNNYPFYFEVFLNDTNELIYKSPLIPVGKTIKDITLDKELSKGDYIATCLYHFVDENSEEAGGDISFEITLKIQN